MAGPSERGFLQGGNQRIQESPVEDWGRTWMDVVGHQGKIFE